MRDYVLTAFIFALVPFCFARPWIGILAWYWIGLMNPHRLTWDFAYAMPFAMAVGVATLLGTPLARDRRPVPWDREIVLSVVLLAYFALTTFFAWAPAYAWVQLEKVAKVILMTLVATMFIYGQRRIRYLLLVIVGSIGFYGFKGGIRSIMTGGAMTVVGPEGSFIDGNTFLSLALNMVIPLMVALGLEEPRRWLRRFFYLTAFLSVVASIFTYSRGGWLGLAAVLALMLLQVKFAHRVLLASALIAIALAAQSIFPERVFTRANTLENYEEDCSANQRLMSWTVHWNVAKASPIVGAGFQFEEARDGRWLTFGDEKYLPCFGVSTSSAAHNIYLQVLGQHGFIAFGFYMLLLVLVQLKLNRIRREARRIPGAGWIASYATGIQIGLIGYLVSGTFLSSAYFDLPWLYFALTVILSRELPLTAPRTSGVGKFGPNLSRM